MASPRIQIPIKEEVVGGEGTKHNTLAHSRPMLHHTIQ